MTTAAVVLRTTRRPLDNPWPVIEELARCLTEPARPAERYTRLVRAIRALIPCDSAVLLRLEGEALAVVAADGLAPEATSQRFALAEQPRLAQFLRARQPTAITDHGLPDPFDGLIGGDAPLSRVHACVGCALVVDDQAIGVLALDALDPRALDGVDPAVIVSVAALAAEAVRSHALLAQLERDAAHADRIARDLMRDSAERAGSELIGASPALIALRDEIALAGRSDLAVLITGETGVGKEVVARAIHAASPRAHLPLIYVNCAALPEQIVESELFGHLRGAFTGATDHRSGKFEIADGATLFLDEIGELPLAIQPKLLRALQSGEIQRVGSDKALRVDVRIIAATNRDLPDEVGAGRFRADLYHRLSVYPIAVPPLRAHRDDISLLAGYFLDQARLRLGLGRIRLTAAARAALDAADWPGNVRELEHTILRAALRASAGRRRELVVVDDGHLGLAPAAPPPPAPAAPGASVAAAPDGPLQDAVEAFKRQRILAAVDAAGGNWAEAARALGLDRGNLHRLARRLGLAQPRTPCTSGPPA